MPRAQRIDFAALAQECVAHFGRAALDKGIELELDSPPACCAVLDREATLSLLDNLLDNAVRYVPQGGIWSHIRVAPHRRRFAAAARFVIYGLAASAKEKSVVHQRETAWKIAPASSAIDSQQESFGDKT